MIPERSPQQVEPEPDLARAGPPPAPRGIFASFAEPRFRWLFASNTTFFLAMGGQMVLRSWLVYQLTGRELALGLVSAMVGVPMMVVAPLGGAIADRLDRRALVAAGQLVVVGGEVLVLILLLGDRLLFWHLLVMAGLMGAAFPLIMPARQAIVADVVGRARITNAMALNMAAVNTTRVVGPAIAGLLIGVLGLKAAYAINVALYVVGLGCLAGVGAAPPGGGARDHSIAHGLREGVGYVLRNRLVLLLLLFGLVPMFLAMPFQSLLVVFADHIWHVGPQGLGMLSAAAGVGGVVGAVLVAWRAEGRGRLRTMMMSVIGFGVFLLAFALSPWYLLALPLVLLANVLANLYSALNNTAIQVLIPDRVRGRVSSFLMMSFSLPLLGTLPVSAVAEVYGAPTAVAAASVLAVLAALLFYALSPELRRMDRRLHEALAAGEKS